MGADDSVHLARAVADQRSVLTRNYVDFQNLHNLVMVVGGHYPGILVARRDNDPKRNLKPIDIATAIAKLLAAGVPIADQYLILNQWR
jgi:hypothetical protein